jgi:hypothetical protein
MFTLPDRTALMKALLSASLAAGLLLTSSAAWSELAPGSLDVHWNEGAENCATSPQAPIQTLRTSGLGPVSNVRRAHRTVRSRGIADPSGGKH